MVVTYCILYFQEVVTLQKNILIYISIRKLGLNVYFTITIFLVEYYSFTEQNNFRSHELYWIKYWIQYFKLGHYFLDTQYYFRWYTFLYISKFRCIVYWLVYIYIKHNLDNFIYTYFCILLSINVCHLLSELIKSLDEFPWKYHGRHSV